jgi:F-type H+-transporting ATPase subunit b
MIAKLILAFALYFRSEGEGGGSLLSVNFGLAFWTVLTFIILLVILKFVAWKPILTALAEREKKIKDSLELADKAKEDAQKLIEENKQNMLKAEEEGRKIIEQSRVFAEKLKAQMLDDSKTQAQKIIDAATVEINRKKDEAFMELKTQVAEISIQVAEKIMRQTLDNAQQKDLIDTYIKELQKN